LGWSDSSGLSNKDIQVIKTNFYLSIHQMIQNKKRLNGNNLFKSWLNNFQRAYFDENLYDCADQDTKTILNLRKLSYSRIYDDSWKFDLVPSSSWHGGHYVVRAISSNKNDSIIMDPWRGSEPEFFPSNSFDVLSLQPEIVIDINKPSILK